MAAHHSVLQCCGHSQISRLINEIGYVPRDFRVKCSQKPYCCLFGVFRVGVATVDLPISE